MNPDSYIKKFLAILLVAVLVGATGSLVIGYVSNLTTVFSDTGIGVLFGATIFGLIFAIGIFVVLYKMVKS